MRGGQNEVREMLRGKLFESIRQEEQKAEVNFKQGESDVRGW